jgi:hypothetical protein
MCCRGTDTESEGKVVINIEYKDVEGIWKDLSRIKFHAFTGID